MGTRALRLSLIVAGVVIALTTVACSNASEGPAVPAARDSICGDATKLGTLRELPEASGLAASRTHADLVWTHNDSSAPLLYGIGRDGGVRVRLRITGAFVEDWEAVTVAPCPEGACLYVADIGDNHGIRPSIVLYRAVEPAAGASVTEPAQAWRLTYPEGPQDAEAIFAGADGTVFLVTKGDRAPVRLYRVPSTASPVASATLEFVTALTPGAADRRRRVTDAAASPDGRWVALRTNDLLLFYRTADLIDGGDPGTPIEVDVRALNEPQGEGLAWSSPTTLYLAGEGLTGGTLARVTCSLPAP